MEISDVKRAVRSVVDEFVVEVFAECETEVRDTAITRSILRVLALQETNGSASLTENDQLIFQEFIHPWRGYVGNPFAQVCNEIYDTQEIKGFRSIWSKYLTNEDRAQCFIGWVKYGNKGFVEAVETYYVSRKDKLRSKIVEYLTSVDDFEEIRTWYNDIPGSWRIEHDD